VELQDNTSHVYYIQYNILDPNSRDRVNYRPKYIPNYKNINNTRALRSIIIVSLNRLIAIIFAYFNHEDNHYNRFVQP